MTTEEWLNRNMEFDISTNATNIFLSHENMMELLAKTLACHCECLGMNAENSWAICGNTTPPFNNGHYQEILFKWGLVNEKGEPLI